MRPARTVQLHVLRLLLVAAGLGVGCKVTSEDIDYWQGTVKGPGKIVAVLVTDKYPIDLRTHAALALVQMERQDIDGVRELQHALQRLEADTRVTVIENMVPELEAMMRGDESAQREGEGPPRSQARAKDAAFLLITHAGPETRSKLRDAVVGWFAQDFAERSLAGRYSARQVVEALGGPAATKLVEALHARMPKEALVQVAELIGQVGDEDAKARAGQRLIEIERDMESNEFLTWLKGVAQEQLAQTPDIEVTDQLVEATAHHSRNLYINEGAIPAMKHLASQAAVADRLLEIAGNANNPNERRESALIALEGNATEAHLDRLLALATNAENDPTTVRDAAFDRIGDTGSRRAIERLWPLIVDSTDSALARRIRWRAGELVLGLGGPSLVPDFLSRLPSQRDVQYEPEELDRYGELIGEMNPQPRELMTTQLASANWWNQVIAIHFFQHAGNEADVARIQALQSSTQEVKGRGWGERNTVGKVAEAAATALRARLEEERQAAAAQSPRDESSDDNAASNNEQ